MKPDELAKLLLAQALANEAKLPLAALLEHVVATPEVRELARRFGVSPKGYRVEKAPAKALAAALVDVRNTEVLEAACTALAAALVPTTEAARPTETAPTTDLRPMLELRERELAELRARLEAAELAVLKQRTKEDELLLRQLRDQETAIRQRAEIEALRRKSAEATPVADSDAGAAERLRELERLLEDADIVEQALRHRMAEQQSRLQGQETEIAELLALLPKGRKRKAPPPEPEPARTRVLMPHLTPAFHRSLVDKDRRAIERALLAVFTLCTEGPSYPGLEVKQLEGGVGLWSMRAALKLRVYFRWRPDGDVEIEELADREDQHTTLRRLKER